MKLRLLSIILILPVAFLAAAADPADSLLRHLDEILPVREQFSEQRRLNIRRTVADLDTLKNDVDRYAVCRSLYGLLRRYRADSAHIVAGKRLQIARRLNDRARTSSASLNLAESYCSLGDCHAALEILDSIDRRHLEVYQLRYLYNIYGTAFHQLAANEILPERKAEMQRLKTLYRDSSLMVAEPEGAAYFSIKAAQLADAGMWDDALSMLSTGESRFGYDDNAHARRLMATVYGRLGDRRKQTYYLAQAAIADIESGNKESASLLKLAIFLRDQNDEERAYNYIRYALEDAYFSKNYGLTAEILRAIPLIDTAFHEKERSLRRNLYLTLGAVLLLVLAGAGALWMALHQLRRKHRLSRSLCKSNKRLQEANSELAEANYAREQYITGLFDAHSDYIDRVGAFRKNIFRLLKSSQVHKAMELCQSATPEVDELRDMYRIFDEIFLKIHPQFLPELNAYLLPDWQTDPKATALTPELRVVALMRMGIISSGQIAKVLHYTPQTVYNYKTRLRSRLNVPIRDFLRALPNLGRRSR